MYSLKPNVLTKHTSKSFSFQQAISLLVSMMQFICLKQLRGVIIETLMVITIVYLCIQMMKGSYFNSCAWLSLCCPI